MTNKTSGYDLEEVIENACNWIEALAADEFRQESGRMSFRGGFCCLGVAREISGFGDVEYSVKLSDFDKDVLGITPDRLSDTELNEYEAVELGLLTPSGDADALDAPSLVTLNDCHGYTFPKIAKALLSNPDLYFEPAVAAGVEDYFFNGGAA